MRKIIFLLLISAFSVSNSLAQNGFELNVDFATFYVSDTTGRVEVYYSFPQDYMRSFVDQADSKEKVKGDLLVEIIDLERKDTLLNKNWNFKYAVDTTNKDITGLLKFRLAPGLYKFNLVGKDLTDESINDSSGFKVRVEKMPENRFSISDIQVASQISKSQNDNSLFWKNTYEVVPHPSSLFGSKLGQPVLFFYSEFYNLNLDDEPENLRVEHYLFDANNVRRYKKTKYIPRNNSSIVNVDLINITNFPSGIYNLVITLSDTLNQRAVKSSKKVYIYNPDVQDTLLSKKGENKYLTSEFAVMSMKELNQAFEKVTYIATQGEKTGWDDLNSKKAKRKYLYDFWQRRDTVRTTQRNEFKEVYYKRVAQANQKFGSYREGWKTDKGRVYILYGAPSDIERHPNVSDKIPYEIWRYDNIEGGVKFIFADYSGFDSYRLIHSDKTGELSNPNWQRDLRN